MKVWLAILAFALALPSDLMAQGIRNFYKWEVSTSFAYEQHDKRLYEFTTWIKEKILDEYQDNHWGTLWRSISIQKILLENDFFKLRVGLGYATEIHTFKRPYLPSVLFHDYFDQPLLITKYYLIKHAQVPVDYSIRIMGDIRLNAGLIADFSFYKNPSYRSKAERKFRKFTVDFYSLMFYPGLEYSMDRFSVRADYRLFQFKKIDKVIFNGLLFKNTSPPDPRLDDKYETYNPAHIRLTVSYAFGKKELAVRE